MRFMHLEIHLFHCLKICYVSEILTYDEMIQRYADNANISFEEALNFFPKTRMASPRATYRELQVTLF